MEGSLKLGRSVRSLPPAKSNPQVLRAGLTIGFFLSADLRWHRAGANSAPKRSTIDRKSSGACPQDLPLCPEGRRT